MKKILKLLFAAMFALAACAPAMPASIVGEWTLESYGDPSNPTLVAPDIDATVVFDVDRLSGNVGCNQFNGGYMLDGDRISFDPLASTKMACMGAAGDQEAAVLRAFAGAATFSLNDAALTITSEDGASVVVFTRK
ncbi:MAG TPA: META domain-containing protein [Anaerolineales bacterium]|nr:META domain-containing protein [Anaerolineales bacterium]